MTKRNLYATMIELGLPADLLPAQCRGVEVKVNGRLKRSLGVTRWRCHWFLGQTSTTITVELQPWVLTSPLAGEIVAHEAAHVVVGHAVGHGPSWVAWCLKLGGNGQALIEHERVAAYTETRLKVVGVCSRCRAEIRASRRLNPRRRYAHRGCGGEVSPVE